MAPWSAPAGALGEVLAAPMSLERKGGFRQAPGQQISKGLLQKHIGDCIGGPQPGIQYLKRI